MSPLSADHATTAAAPPPTRRPLASRQPATRKPRGNPTLHLAPRCGARTRAGCPCQAPALHGKLRCRLHGGRSTGPRTPEGLANIRAARTIHGNYGAKARAKNRYRITLLCRTRVTVAADRYLDFLPPAFVARLHDYPPELMAPRFPTGGITAAQDQMRRRAVAAALAPWRRAIAAAREAARAARKQAAAARAADPNARVRPRRPRPRRPRPGRPTPQALLAALLAELLAPERAPAAPDTGLTEPCVPFPPAGPAAPAPTPAPDPHPPAAPAVPAQCPPANARRTRVQDRRPGPRTKPHRQNPVYQSAPPPRPTPARQNPVYHFRPPAPLPRRPRPPGTRTPPHTPPRPNAHTQTPSQNPLYQRAHPARAKPPRQNPLYQSPPRPRPPSRPGCPTAPRGGDGCASSAACTAPRPPAPARDRAPGHDAVKCNCPAVLPPTLAATSRTRSCWGRVPVWSIVD